MSHCANCGYNLGLKRPIWWWHLTFCCPACRTLYKTKWWRTLKRRPVHALRNLPENTARQRSMRLGSLLSLATFVVLGGAIVIDQWIAGRVSASSMISTAFLLAGLCTGLFGAIAAVGLAISTLFGDDDAGDRKRKAVA